MEETEYGGIRVSLEALLDNSVTPLKLDISTGDAITPQEIRYPYKLMFEDRSIPLMAYPLETVLAEKLETILSRSTLNSRMRDYYDVQVLIGSFSQEINRATLTTALTATAQKRGSIARLQDAESILCALEGSFELQHLWDAYQKKNSYSKSFSWWRIMRSIRQLAAVAGLQVNNPSEV